MKLDDFVSRAEASAAGLKRVHVLALRCRMVVQKQMFVRLAPAQAAWSVGPPPQACDGRRMSFAVGAPDGQLANLIVSKYAIPAVVIIQYAAQLAIRLVCAVMGLDPSTSGSASKRGEAKRSAAITNPEVEGSRPAAARCRA